MVEKKIYLEEISQEIRLRTHTRIKHLSIKISANSGVVVCIPKGISERKALGFVCKKKDWILKHLSSGKYTAQAMPFKIQLVTGLTVIFEETEHNESKIKQKNTLISITVPKALDFQEKEELKRFQFEKVLRKEAKVFLPQRLKELAALHHFEYKSMRLKKQKTRWGSCSFNDVINLNIQLIRLPLHLVDYVIIHELCHTVHKNHSADFWQLVSQYVTTELYVCKKEMRKQRIEL